MLHDLRYGFRTLLQAKGWTLVIVLSLALGIGANTALFSSANGLLLKKLPVQDPDSLVRLQWAGRNDLLTNHSEFGFLSGGARAAFSYHLFQQLAHESRTMAELFGSAPLEDVNVIVDGKAEIATASVVTGNYYEVLGVSARLGRTLMPEDDQPTAPAAAVISYRFWHSRFGGSPEALGSVVRVNDVPVTIVGVLPPEFTGIQRAISTDRDISVPLSLDALITPDQNRLASSTHWWLSVMGRLKPGVIADQLQARIEPVFRHTARSNFETYVTSLSQPWRARSEVPQLQVVPASRGLYDVRPEDVRAVTIVSVVVVLVLLLVCANVANLLLSRASARQKEISVRLSLGASRARLIRQLLTESLLLASMGSALGLVVADWGRHLLPVSPAAFDWRVAVFVVAATFATGIAFGVGPAFRSTGVNVSATLKENSRSIVASRSLPGRLLLIVQVAISLVLLIGAGLFLRTVNNLRHVDVGFNPRNLVLFQMSPRLNQYDEVRTRLLYERLAADLRTIPAVQGVALSHPALLSGWVSATDMYVRGRAYPPDHGGHHVREMTISPEFFGVMQMPLLAGRSFTAADAHDAPKVAVVNDAAVRKYFGTDSPLGERFGTSPQTTGEYEIVGIVRDVRYDSLRDAAPPTIYLPAMQRALPSVFVQVRTAGDPLSIAGAIRDTVRRIDPDLPVMNVATQGEQIEQRFATEKLFARACGLFGAVALLIAGLGIFGLMSYSVARRTNEIGIRMALGAQAKQVRGLILRESMAPVLAGITIGLAGAIAAGRLIRNILFGVHPADPIAIAAAVATLLAVATAASYLPARRASQVDPLVALRYE